MTGKVINFYELWKNKQETIRRSNRGIRREYEKRIGMK